MRTVGGNIRALRIARGFPTQRSFARALKWEQSRVSDLENDRYGRPDTTTLQHIKATLGCSVDDLLEGTSPNTKFTSNKTDRAYETPGSVLKPNSTPISMEVESDVAPGDSFQDVSRFAQPVLPPDPIDIGSELLAHSELIARLAEALISGQITITRDLLSDLAASGDARRRSVAARRTPKKP